LIAEQTKGHHAELPTVLNSMHRRSQQPDGQKKSGERRYEPPDRGPHGEPRFEIAATELRLSTK
jgi:hypothetical protein